MPVSELVNKPITLPVNLAGVPGSGWKPDVPVANSMDSEVHPSMGSFVNSTTGNSTLYLAYVVRYNRSPYGYRWELRIARSLNGGATWGLLWSTYYAGQISIENPSLAVSAYNNTIFVATERSPGTGGSHDIELWRYAATSVQYSLIDDDADDDRYPSLTIEYSWGISNFLYVSYENVTTVNDVDLCLARSTDWGQTWTKQLLRGGALDTDVYHQSDITYAQGNVYIAYRHSTDLNTTGHIDVSYSKDYGATWTQAEDISRVPSNAAWPSVAGSRIGAWHEPSAVIVVYQYVAATTSYDILYTWSHDYGGNWTGGNDYYHQIAASAMHEVYPQLAVDGMGTENTNVGGNFHLIYDKGLDLYYTQLPYWDIPKYYGGPQPYIGYYLGWSSPHGVVTDDNAVATYGYPFQTIAAYTRVVGSEALWEPAVAWIDTRTFNVTLHDIYYSTPGTDFSITFAPSSQKVVAGKPIAYYVTVNLLGGPTAPAYMSGNTWPWIIPGSNFAFGEYSDSPISPTAVSVLRVTTSNLMPAGDYQFNITATVGGYRRIASIPFTVVAPPTLSLILNPNTVARGKPLTLSGQLTPAPGAPATIYIYYRYPHQTGTWKLATTLQTNAAGAYSATATVPMSLPIGQYDLVAFWVNTQNGEYAVAPMKLLTIT
jgi:hypothetical protein